MSHNFAPGVAAQPAPNAARGPLRRAEAGGQDPCTVRRPPAPSMRPRRRRPATAMPASGRCSSAPSASSTAISARARSTPSARRWSRPRTDGILLPEEVIGTRLADPLGADHDRHDQIRRDPAAHGQQGRGRHPLADGAGPEGARAARASCSCWACWAPSLFYGDAVITPAISVLSAVEGLKLVTPAFERIRPADHGGDHRRPVPRAEPRHGKVAAFFGPITSCGSSRWPSAALPHVGLNPEVFRALQPLASGRYLLNHGNGALVALGAVFLAVTGAEALYRRSRAFRAQADPGRLARPRLPCLALELSRPGARWCSPSPRTVANPFFQLVPDWALMPMVVLATRRHGHRQPGGDHRRLLADPAGGAARPAAAPGGPAHLRDPMPARSTCRRSTDAAGRRGAARGRVPARPSRWPPPTASR